jgi:protein TonB
MAFCPRRSALPARTGVPNVTNCSGFEQAVRTTLCIWRAIGADSVTQRAWHGGCWTRHQSVHNHDARHRGDKALLTSPAPALRATSHRLLPHALCASALLHLLAMLWPVAMRHANEAHLRPLRVELRHATPASIALAIATEVNTPQPALRRPMTTAPARSSVQAKRTQSPIAANDAPPAVASAPASTADTAIAEPPAPTASAEPAPQNAVAARTPSAESGADALDRFGRACSEALAARRDYPRLAALRGWQGEVRLRIHFARHGSLASVELARSSGIDTLDEHALRLAREGSPLPAVPEALQDREFDLLVPVQYRLARNN